jgi:hypothetical protein
MKIEDRLSDAMHDYADAIEPSTDSWRKIAARFDDAPGPRRSVPGRLVFAGVAITLVVVLIAVVAIRDDGPTSKVATGPVGAATKMPSRIFAVNEDGHATILDSATGTQEGGIYEFPDVAEGTQIAVTPDGQDAYVVGGNGNEGCTDHLLLRLPVGPGARGGDQIATEATEPTVSPDGNYLAYLHCLPGDNRADEIVLRDLATGTERTTAAPPGTFFINRLEFTPDSRHVVFNMFDDATGRSTGRELDLVVGEAPPGREVAPSGWLGVRGQTGEYLEVLPEKAVGAISVATWNPFDSTATMRFEVPSVPSQVVSDRSGDHLLAVADGGLYRWSVGDEKPTKLSGNYIGAAWIPDEAPTRLPNGVLAALGGEHLAVLGSVSGRQHSSLGTFPGITHVATTADGRQVFFAATGKSGACGNGPQFDVTKLVPATGESTAIGPSGSGSPAVSPDGQYLAVGVSCAGPSLGFTSLETGANFGADALGSVTTERSPGIRVVDPLGWSPDSTRLVYRVHLEADNEPRYYVGRLWPVVPQAQTQVVELPNDAGISAATFVGDDQVATAEPRGATTAVRRWTVSSGAREIASPMIFEVPGQVTELVADASGQHLLAVTDDHVLYRWSAGDPAPTKLAEGVTAAAWIPWS